MSGLEIIGLIGGLAGTALSAAGAIAEGNFQEAMGEAQAKASEREASEQRAASQREAIQRSREARLVLSRQQAVAAASGAGPTDTTIMGLMGEAAAAGQFNTASAIYEGESRGRALEDDAALSRFRGKQAKLASFINAGSTVLSGISGFASGFRDMRQRKTTSFTPSYRFGD